jgi:hypothetical protein
MSGTSAARRGTISIGDFAGLTDALHVERDYPADTLESRVERLEQQVTELKAAQQANQQAISQEVAERREAVKQVSERIEHEGASMREEIAAIERTAILVDTRALPVVGLGIECCRAYLTYLAVQFSWAASPSPPRSRF